MTSNKNDGDDRDDDDDDDVVIDFHGHAKRERFKQNIETYEMMAEFSKHSLQKQKSLFRKILSVEVGTNCAKNDADPLGDGDQTPLVSERSAERARELYSIGGDIHQHLEEHALSKFGLGCAMGIVQVIRDMINDATKYDHPSTSFQDEDNDGRRRQPWYCCNNEKNGRNQTTMAKLLETRETSMRLSPLLLIVSAGKNFSTTSSKCMHHQDIAKVLLKNGANPRAKDVLGKTVAHYGAGAYANPMTIDVVDMCIAAARSSHLFGQTVKLHHLQKAEHLNDAMGIAGGYDPDSMRRVVYLTNEQKEVWIKPENMSLHSSPDTNKKGCPSSDTTMLLEVQDRMGSISLHEVLMNDRKDVAEFLIQKHGTSIHTKDMDGVSPMTMVTNGGQMSFRNVSKIILDVARKEGKKARNEKKQMSLYKCAECGKELNQGDGKQCSGCKQRVYCDRECQLKNWRFGHNKECKELQTLNTGVQIHRPSSLGQSFSAISLSSGQTHTKGSYRKPIRIQTDEKFVVKVQGGTEYMPIMVYDESRMCQFDIEPGTSGFNEVLREIRKEKTWQGRKTFMKASFDSGGTFIAYPLTAGVKSKYSW